MAFIYCITNLINNKRYVGKTTQSIEERFKEHCRDSRKESKSKRPLYNAMRKYGIENFKIELLEEVENEKILSEKEIYWIKELESYGSHGYNATKGGDGKILYDYNEIIELYSLGYNIKRLSEKMQCDPGTISRVLKSHGVKVRKGKEKRIDQFDLANNYIQSFIGCVEAANWLIDHNVTKTKGARHHIRECCIGKIKQAYGYKWVFAKTTK